LGKQAMQHPPLELRTANAALHAWHATPSPSIITLSSSAVGLSRDPFNAKSAQVGTKRGVQVR
jgi:hypothetical protein